MTPKDHPLGQAGGQIPSWVDEWHDANTPEAVEGPVKRNAPLKDKEKPPRGVDPEIRLLIAIEAIRGTSTQNELSRKYGVSQPLISCWKREAIDVLRKHFIDRMVFKGARDEEKQNVFFRSLDFQSLAKFPVILRDLAEVAERLSRNFPDSSESENSNQHG